MRPDIVEFGETIRSAMEEFAVSDGNPGDILPGDLSCGCAVASYFYARELRRRLRIYANFIATQNHCFVEFNRYIYDLTATQFGRTERVYVIKKPYGKDYEMVRDMTGSGYLGSAYTTKNRLGVSYVHRDWPRGQRPIDYRLTWIDANKPRIRYVGPR